MKQNLQIQVKSQVNEKVIFERIVTYDSAVRVPFDDIISSLDFLFVGVPHVIVFNVMSL